MQWLIICTPSRSLPCLDCGTNARHSTLPWMRSHILLHLYKRREHPTKSAIAIRMFLEILYPPSLADVCTLQNAIYCCRNLLSLLPVGWPPDRLRREGLQVALYCGWTEPQQTPNISAGTGPAILRAREISGTLFDCSVNQGYSG